MTSRLMEKRELLRKSTRRIRPHETVVEDFLVTVLRIDPALAQRQEVRRLLVARPVVGPVEFETNPIIQIHPDTGKHYRMVVARRSTASFKPTALQVTN